ncbi:MAG: hypothetical protein ACF8NJ_10920 [Phycisphaerales bacterium JB038]
MDLVVAFLIVLIPPMVIWTIAESAETPARRRVGTVIAMLFFGVLATISYSAGHFLGQARATTETTGDSLIFFEEASAALDAGRVDEVQQALARLLERGEDAEPIVYERRIAEAVALMRGEE